jgi:hypothetical protein
MATVDLAYDVYPKVVIKNFRRHVSARSFAFELADSARPRTLVVIKFDNETTDYHLITNGNPILLDDYTCWNIHAHWKELMDFERGCKNVILGLQGIGDQLVLDIHRHIKYILIQSRRC